MELGGQRFTISHRKGTIEIATIVCPIQRLSSVVERYLVRQTLPLEIASAPAIAAMLVEMDRWNRRAVVAWIRRTAAAHVFQAFAD